MEKSDNQYFKAVILTTAQAVHGTYSDSSAFLDEERYQSERALLGIYHQVVALLKTKSYDELEQHIGIFFNTIKESNDFLTK